MRSNKGEDQYSEDGGPAGAGHVTDASICGSGCIPRTLDRVRLSSSRRENTRSMLYKMFRYVSIWGHLG